MLKQRVMTAIVMVIVFMAAVFWLPEDGWAALAGLMVWQGAREWRELAGMGKASGRAYSAAVIVSYVLLWWLQSHSETLQRHQLQLAVYGAAAAFWVLLVPLWLADVWRTKSKYLLGLIGMLLLLPTALAMLDLRAVMPAPWWLLGVMALVWVADITAYFSGRKFGRHKLAPSISPGKTWEGVAGAVAGVAVYLWVVLWLSGMMQHYELIAFAMLGVALSIIGDLFESAIKRQAGMKDSGTLLPGHGGLLDRIDALTSTMPVAVLILILLGYM